MRLTDLLCKMYENTTIWVAEDPTKSEGVYFGPAKEITFGVAAAYDVVEIYPEYYPAIRNYAGITIIVKRRTVAS